jgi:hypothetical protein
MLKKIWVKKKKKGFRHVAGSGAATGKYSRRRMYAGRDEDSSLFLKYQEHLRERRERREKVEEPRERK